MTASCPPARRRARLLATVVGVAVVLSACGVPVDDEPRVIRPESVPFDLLGQADADAPEAPPDHRDARPTTIYLVALDEGQLVLRASSRKIATPVNLDTVARNLMAGGVTGAERLRKEANFVPGREMRQLTTIGDKAVIDVNKAFFTRLPRNQSGRLAIAQIVWTVTEFVGQTGTRVSQVQFTVEGSPTPVPDATGSTQSVVTREDYTEFLPVLTADTTVSTSTTVEQTADPAGATSTTGG